MIYRLRGITYKNEITSLHIDIQQEYLSILVNQEFTITITKEHLAKFDDCGYYSLFIDTDIKNFYLIDKHRIRRGNNDLNSFHELYIGRRNNVLQIMVPVKDMDFTQFSYFITTSISTQVTCNENIINSNIRLNSANYLPRIEITGPDTVSQDRFGDYTIRCTNYEKDMYVYPRVTGGYINKQKLFLSNGVGILKFLPLGLEVGEKVELIIDFRQRMDKANKIIEIIS